MKTNLSEMFNIKKGDVLILPIIIKDERVIKILLDWMNKKLKDPSDLIKLYETIDIKEIGFEKLYFLDFEKQKEVLKVTDELFDKLQKIYLNYNE